MRRVKVGRNRWVGPKDPCLVMVDAGVNHNNDTRRAIALIDRAAEAGADVVKFQTYKADTLTTKKAPRYWNPSLDRDRGGTQYDTFKKLDRLPASAYRMMKKRCDERGVIFCSTPFDIDSAKFLDRLGMGLFKISSSDLTYPGLLDLVARTGKPVILSTGTATINEMEEAVNIIYAAGNRDVVLQHCVLSYPCRDRDANLAKMVRIQQLFPEIPVGYSDHTLGLVIPFAAAALGARSLEKHYTLDKALPDSPDHSLSVDPEELKKMVEGIRRVEKSVGKFVDGYYEAEKKGYMYARKSIVAKACIPKGAVIKQGMLTCKRPGTGIYPKYMDRVVGARAAISIKADTTLTYKMIK